MAQAQSPSRQAPAASPPGLRLEERIYYDLLGRIRSGVYQQGAKLPTENDLSNEFGVSRPVVRSALARLRTAGLIVSRRGAGSFVSTENLDNSTGYRGLGSVEDITEYYRFRRLIECDSAGKAAERRDDSQLQALREELVRMDENIQAGQATIEHDFRFHLLLAEISGNRFIGESLAMLQPHMLFVSKFMRSLTPSGYASSKQRMQAEHGEIVDAIQDRDPAAARAAMEHHIRSSEYRIFRGENNAG